MDTGQALTRFFHFNPRPPWGGRQTASRSFTTSSLFQSTPSVGRATSQAQDSRGIRTFQSTPSVGRATIFRELIYRATVYFNPRPPWGGRPRSRAGAPAHKHFNPRPPWGGRPARSRAGAPAHKHFNPRPPWGGRHVKYPVLTEKLVFQSTPSVGRATSAYRHCSNDNTEFQSTPSVGRATYLYQIADEMIKFQSTPSVGRATQAIATRVSTGDISIHALRGEGDDFRASSCRCSLNFNPRPPWGGRRRIFCCSISCGTLFQSTPSVGRATLKHEGYSCDDWDISIHALRGEGDESRGSVREEKHIFQSTPSVGRATREGHFCPPPAFISIHALRGEGDCITPSLETCEVHFNPRPPWGGRRESGAV